MHCLAEELEERGGTDYGLNICSKYSSRSTNLTLISPGYPHSYPQHIECRCIVAAQRYSKVCVHSQSLYSVTLYDCLTSVLVDCSLGAYFIHIIWLIKYTLSKNDKNMRFKTAFISRGKSIYTVSQSSEL